MQGGSIIMVWQAIFFLVLLGIDIQDDKGCCIR